MFVCNNNAISISNTSSHPKMSAVTFREEMCHWHLAMMTKLYFTPLFQFKFKCSQLIVTKYFTVGQDTLSINIKSALKHAS